jgi:hypothetical protein
VAAWQLRYVGDLAGLDVPEMSIFAEKSNNIDPFSSDTSNRLFQPLLIGKSIEIGAPRIGS